MNHLIKPMKAHKYRPDRVVRPGFLQPKLNGLRAIWNGKTLNTYNLEEWNPNILNHIVNAIHECGLQEFKLDGEIYVHGQSLQWINSRASVNRKERHKEASRIQFHIFDVANNRPFADRKNELDYIAGHISCQAQLDHYDPDIYPLQICPTYSFNSENEENIVFKLCRQEGYEGMIYRAADEEYGFLNECGNKENRWWKIMKRKFWEDMDATIVGCCEGEGKFEYSLGSFLCEGENGTQFNVGTGEALTHERRDYFWGKQDSIIGTRCKVKYEMLSDSGVPLKPTLEAVYE